MGLAPWSRRVLTDDLAYGLPELIQTAALLKALHETRGEASCIMVPDDS
jgi:hypothetical protein